MRHKERQEFDWRKKEFRRTRPWLTVVSDRKEPGSGWSVESSLRARRMVLSWEPKERPVMTLHLHLGAELEAKLRKRAAAAGKDEEAFALEAVRERLARPETFDEILAPLRNEARKSGMSDKELDALLQSAIDESRRKRKKKA